MALEEYTPQTDFSQDEANQVSGRSMVRTTQLDAEFANLETSIDSLIARLQAISRDDDALQDGVVTYESLAAELVTLIGSAGFSVRGAWVTTTAYTVGDMVSNGTGTYVCAEAHTSGTFATDLAAGKWVLLFDSASVSAANVSVTPAGGISATDAQAAIEELDSEKMSKAANGSDVVNAAIFRSNISVPSKAEVQNQTHTYSADTGTSDALVITLSPAPAAYSTGLRAAVKKSASASSSTAPTLNANALGAKVIYARGGAALVAGDMPAGAHIDLTYDEALNGGVGGWELINPAGETGLSSIVAFSGFLTPSALTADQNDYNPTGLTAASTLRLSGNADWSITGIAGGAKGRILLLHNVGSYALSFPAESSSSTAANRFIADFTLEPTRGCMIEWDDTSSRWRPLDSVVPVLAGTITPAQITSNQNDYSPTGLSTATILRINSDAARDITGLAGGGKGGVKVITNTGSFTITLKGESASSAAANRFSGSDVSLAAGGTITLYYDATSSRWRVLATSGSAGITLGTPQATTSGTSLDFTGIPVGTKMIVVSFAAVSSSGTSGHLIQIGDSGGVETSGYSAAMWAYNGTGTGLSTVGFNLHNAPAAAGTYSGQLILTLIDASTNTWAASHIYTRDDVFYGWEGTGSKSLSGTLDRIRLTTVGGADTFDAGKFNILYFG